jgi:L-alanine-DL-glutamate epimerase-like enolase superfamily enzyme
MRITAVEAFHADGGWEPFSFLKLSTDEGLVGWSEFNEARGRQGLSGLVLGLARSLIGQDPRQVSKIEAQLYASTRSTAGGVQAHAIAAVVNACLDLKAKALNVPVYELFGGAIRTRLPTYWSHCGLYRARFPSLFEDVIGKPAVRSLDDIKALGREVAASGFKAFKTNSILFDEPEPRVHGAGFGRGVGHPELKADERLIGGLRELLAAFREGAGDEVEIMLDLNFNFKPEALRRVARAVEPYRLAWLEADLYDAEALAAVRRECSTPIASLEAILGRRALRPFLEAGAVDIAIVDVQWNGFTEAYRMAAMIDAHEVNLASHNSSGPLSTLISAHLCAVIPNFQILELDVDAVPWRDSLMSHPFDLQDGEFVLSNRPGWGCDINEDVVRAHPAR